MTKNIHLINQSGDNHLDKKQSKKRLSVHSPPNTMQQWLNEHSQEIIIIWDDSGVLHDVSQSIATILNINPAEWIGKPWKDIFVKANKNIPTIFAKNGSELKNIRVNLQDHDGNNFWFNSTTSSLVHDEQKYFMTSLVDITQKLKLEELVIQSENLTAAGELAAGLAHEIRNPLTSIKGFLQLLSAGVDAKDAYYKIMSDEIDKIEAITSELLFLSKPTTTKKQPESVLNMITEVSSLLKSEARMKNINLSFAQKDDATIYCNQTQIKQALINIIKNAIEAVEANTQITITVTKNNDSIIIDVIDEGPGVPEYMIDQLNEPFYTTKQEGTGLGLMITQKIVDDHGGSLDVLKNDVKGSTFRLIFPIYKSDKKED